MKSKLLFEKIGEKLNLLLLTYDEDKDAAGIFYRHNRSSEYQNEANFGKKTIYYFKKKDGFEIVKFVRIYGISKVNKKYSREKVDWRFTVKNNKFWFSHLKEKTPIKQAKIKDILQIIDYDKSILEVIAKELPWLTFLLIDYKGLLYNTTLNKIVKNKAFSFRKAVSLNYNLNYPMAKKMWERNSINKNAYLHNSYQCYLCEELFNHPDLFTGKDNINPYFLEVATKENTNEHHQILYQRRQFLKDFIKLAKTIGDGYQINLSWSVRRMKEEHDKLTDKLNEVMFKSLASEPLNVHPIYQDFAKTCDELKLIDDNKYLLLEGLKRKHCVATYKDRVEKGECAIFSVGGFTLQVAYDSYNNKLEMRQFKGYRNNEAPNILKRRVTKYLDEFNSKLTPRNYVVLPNGGLLPF